jgi:hypothetical protein
VEAGKISTTIRGNEAQVFGALRAGSGAVTARRDTALVATVSNAC